MTRYAPPVGTARVMEPLAVRPVTDFGVFDRSQEKAVTTTEKRRPDAPVSPPPTHDVADISRSDFGWEEISLRSNFHLSPIWGGKPPDIGSLPHHILVASDAGEISQHAQIAAQYLQACFHAKLETLTVPSGQKNPAPAILQRAAESSSSLIVMGTHGRKGKDRVKHGSVAEAVIKEAKCSVLVVKGGVDFAKIRSILVPLDGSESGLRTVALALHLGALWGAECWLFHAQRGDNSPSGRFPQWMSLLQNHNWRQVESRQGKDIHDIAEAILKEEQENAVDWIVMGTHREAIHERMLPNSVCLEILRGTHVPLWVLPA